MEILNQVKFDSPSDEVIVWKFPSEDLKLGSQLIVNQSQEAIFVKGGVVMDIFGPGTYTLTTGNLPLISGLINFPFGGKTPFTAEVWFINKTSKRNMKWGTSGPIQVIDPTYQFPISVRSFGKWGFRIVDSHSFVKQIVGSLQIADSKKVEEYFIGEISQKFSNLLSTYFTERRASVFELASRLNELSDFTQTAIASEFARYGIEVTNFNVERVSIPDEEQKRFQEILGKRMEVDQLSKVEVTKSYVTVRTLDALEKAASNEGGGVAQSLGTGIGIAAGLGLGGQLSENLRNAQVPAPSQDDPVIKLKKLKELLEAGLISEDDFAKKKSEVLASI